VKARTSGPFFWGRISNAPLSFLEKVPGLFLEKVPGLFSAFENKPGTFSAAPFPHLFRKPGTFS